MSQPQTPRFLLLQARNPGDPGQAHEQQCFEETLGVPSGSIRSWDLLKGPPQDEDLDKADMLLVGGSGDYSVLDDVPFVQDFIGFLRDVVIPRNIPTFASCFGFQAIVLAAGGELVRDPESAEVGTFAISVSNAGREDPLLGSLFPTFKAQLGHKDRVERLPDGLTSLAASERSREGTHMVMAVSPRRPTPAVRHPPSKSDHPSSSCILKEYVYLSIYLSIYRYRYSTRNRKNDVSADPTKTNEKYTICKTKYNSLFFHQFGAFN